MRKKLPAGVVTSRPHTTSGTILSIHGSHFWLNSAGEAQWESDWELGEIDPDVRTINTMLGNPQTR